jgi:uncharacterized membrane protein
MTTTEDSLSITPEAGAAPRAMPVGPWGLRLALGLIGVAGMVWLTGLLHVRLRVHAPDTALLAAQPFAIKFHLVTVLAAFAIGCVLMAGIKGSLLHRALGWAWVVLMVSTAAASFFIHGLNPHGLSLIHALSAWVVVAAPFGLSLARRHHVAAHRQMMTALFLFGLLVAGAFTFIPGRLMFQMFFG